MSLQRFAPHHWGLILPQDPLTGALGKPWIADGVLDVTIDHPAELVEYPVELDALNPTGGVIFGADTFSVQFRCSNTYSPGIQPEMVGPDRALKIRDAFMRLRDRRLPVAVLVRGDGLVRNRIIGPVSEERPKETAEILLSVTFGRWDPVSLERTAVQQDADLIALGGQIVSGGQL
jgi:hypothetical protein